MEDKHLAVEGVNDIGERAFGGGALRLMGRKAVLRPLVFTDWLAVHDYAGRPETCRFLQWGPNTPEGTRMFVREAVKAMERDWGRHFALAIVERSGGRLIGACTLRVESERHRRGVIGYVLHPRWWRQGYGTEAARLLCGFGFEILRLHRIEATCDPRNWASAKVLQKCGMRWEGRLREHMRARRGWRDSDVYGVLVAEWQGETATVEAIAIGDRERPAS